MQIFGQLIRTAVNIVTLPIAVVKDVVTLGGTLTGENVDYEMEETYTARKLRELKEEAGEK